MTGAGGTAWRLAFGALALAACAGASGAPGVSGARPPAPVAPPATTDVVTPTAARAAFRAAVDSMLADPKWSTARWGVLVVDPASGDTLYSRDAGKLFMPASNQKLVTGAAALAVLGADWRWRTSVAIEQGARARVGRDGVLRGDVHVIGRGDPTMSDTLHGGDALAPLRAVADTLHARGVRRVTGTVVATGDAFPGDPYGFGWAADDFDYAYSAPVSELLFHEGFARVTVVGGRRPGERATVRVTPTPGALPVEVDVGTATPGVVGMGTTATRVTARWLPMRATYRLEGVVSVGDSATLTLAQRDPRAAYTGALRDVLRARGIAVGDAPAARRACGTAPCPAPALDTVATLLSPTLAEVLPRLQKPSQNQVAELLLRTLGLERGGAGTADSGRRVVYAQLHQWGVTPERDAVVRDGSGLSRHDYVTPTALVRVLDAMRRRPDFAVFRDALPVAGVDGTLAGRMKGTPAAGNVRAKTGTVDRARSLSGYVTSADGVLLVFSLLCNNHTVPNREVEQVQDAIAARLAAMRVGAAQAAAR